MELISGRFVRRVNRFVAEVEHDGRHYAHVPSSGRMQELLLPGSAILLEDKGLVSRKYRYKLSFVRKGSVWVSIDSLLPNRLVGQALKDRLFDQLSPYDSVRNEATFGQSRFDFLLLGPHPLIIEVKSVTLVEQGRAMFPDAPTQRGLKHLEELIMLAQQGYPCVVLFVIQREDALSFRANGTTDPKFAQALRQAKDAGVRTIAYDCSVVPPMVSLRQEVPVVF
jgi:sugar fermentation stimulation protein A